MSSPCIKITEDTIPFEHNGETLHTFYKICGNLSTSSCRPLVVLHGGPGITHDVLISLVDLAALPLARPVILYDQIGNGRSTHLPEKPDAFWHIDLFIDELVNLLERLDIASDFDLLGHSWGGMLAAEFIIRRQPAGLRCLVLANSLASIRIRNQERQRLYKEMPEGDAKVLLEEDEDMDPHTDGYKRAMGNFRARHLCRMDPMPEPVIYTIKQMELDRTVADKMDVGKCWDVIGKVHLIRVPTLVLNGEYDFATDKACAPFVQHIEKVKWVKFSRSSHMPHWEERARYMGVVEEFLSAHADKKDVKL